MAIRILYPWPVVPRGPHLVLSVVQRPVGGDSDPESVAVVPRPVGGDPDPDSVVRGPPPRGRPWSPGRWVAILILNPWPVASRGVPPCGVVSRGSGKRMRSPVPPPDATGHGFTIRIATHRPGDHKVGAHGGPRATDSGSFQDPDLHPRAGGPRGNTGHGFSIRIATHRPVDQHKLGDHGGPRTTDSQSGSSPTGRGTTGGPQATDSGSGSPPAGLENI